MSALETPASSSASKPLMLASAPPLDPYSFIPTLEGDELKSVVEYFLSRTYLEGDPYLVSQMNSDLYIPVQVLTDRISQWVCPVDLENVKTAIASSNEVSFDETKNLVRPNFKLSRNTIILRDLPDTTEQQIKDLFADDATCSPQEVTKEVGNCWFVSFENESSALHALSHIRKKEVNGMPIRARLKQESLLRSSNVVDSSAHPYYSSDYYYGAYDQGQYEEGFSASGESRDGKDSNRRGGHNKYGRGRSYGGRKGGRDSSHPSGGTSESSGRGYGSRGNRSNASNGGGGNRQGSSSSSSSSTTSSSGRKRASSTKKGSNAPINLGLAHFPPLNTQEKKGHPQSIKVWSKSDLIEIVSNLETPQPPKDLPDCIAIVPVPNTTLEIITPLPKVETVDVQRNVKGPDYKAVALKSANTSSSSKQPKQEQKKAPKASNSPPAAADAAAPSNDHSQKNNSKGGKQNEQKKSSNHNSKKHNSPPPSHSNAESQGANASSAPSPAHAAAPAQPKEGSSESPRPPSNDGEGDKISWARLVSKPNDHHHSQDGSSESH